MKKIWNTHVWTAASKKILCLSVACLILLSCLSFIDCKAATSGGSGQLAFNSYAQPLQSFNNTIWETGANQSTPLVQVNYTETMPQANFLQRTMTLSYGWGTAPFPSTVVSATLLYTFNPGGINDTVASYPNYNPQVLNWTQLNGVQLMLTHNGNFNGVGGETTYSFNGFDIINGTAQQLSLSKVGDSTDYSYTLNNVVGSIWYANCSAAVISPVDLTTENTTYNGNAITDSVATFNVTLDAQITNNPLDSEGLFNSGLPPIQFLNDVPVTLTFQVTENSAYTAYKYGVNVDWSADNAFPTTGLNSGDDFSLVAADSLSLRTVQNNQSSSQVFSFSTDAQNDSAIYSVNGTVLCQELFPLNYTINGSPQAYNTTRLYVPIQSYLQSSEPSFAGNSSAMYVCFDGFDYNQSSGFSFDPTVITYNSVSNNSPSPTPAPSSAPTSNPTSTPSPTSSSPSPTISPTSTPKPSSTGSPSPTLPEFPSILGILMVLLVVSLSVAVLIAPRKNKITRAHNALASSS